MSRVPEWHEYGWHEFKPFNPVAGPGWCEVCDWPEADHKSNGRDGAMSILGLLGFAGRKERELRKIAAALKKHPTCLACEIEGQQHTCESIGARWYGREILRILDRPGWVTKALDDKPKEAATPSRPPEYPFGLGLSRAPIRDVVSQVEPAPETLELRFKPIELEIDDDGVPYIGGCRVPDSDRGRSTINALFQQWRSNQDSGYEPDRSGTQ